MYIYFKKYFLLIRKIVCEKYLEYKLNYHTINVIHFLYLNDITKIYKN